MGAKDVSGRGERCKQEAAPYLSRHRSETHAYAPAASALLIIDMQEQFIIPSSRGFLPDSELIVDNIEALLKAYRKHGLPVIHTRHALGKGEQPGHMGRWWKEVLKDGNPLTRTVERLAPINGETAIRKAQYSAFAGTRLDQVLKAKGISKLLITGVMTHLCCDTTARDAFMRGYDVYLVVDGTASRNEELHMSSVRALSDGFVIPVTTKEVLARLRRR